MIESHGGAMVGAHGQEGLVTRIIQHVVERCAVYFNAALHKGMAYEPPALKIKNIQLALMLGPHMGRKHGHYFIYRKVGPFKRKTGHIAITFQNRHVVFVGHGIRTGVFKRYVQAVVNGVDVAIDLEQGLTAHGATLPEGGVGLVAGEGVSSWGGASPVGCPVQSC